MVIASFSNSQSLSVLLATNVFLFFQKVRNSEVEYCNLIGQSEALHNICLFACIQLLSFIVQFHTHIMFLELFSIQSDCSDDCLLVNVAVSRYKNCLHAITD